MDTSTPTPTPIDSAPVTTTAPSESAATDRLEAMTPAERSDWRLKGSPAPSSAPVASAQADGDAGDAGDEAAELAPAVVPATPVDAAASAAGKALRKRTAQERINELARKNYLLEGELNAFRRQSSQPAAADPSAQPPIATPPVAAAATAPVKPKAEDFAVYDDYIDAAIEYRTQVAQAAEREARANETQASQHQQIVTAADARITAFAAAHPDYHDVINGQTEIRPTPLLLDAVTHSELNAAIAYHLCSHPDEYRALVALAPGPMLKALGKLEARLEAATPPAAAAAAAPTPKHVTTAPAPPTTLGSRPAVPADEVGSAIARRDFTTYRREQNARELAARR